jgi:hypothetical protein
LSFVFSISLRASITDRFSTGVLLICKDNQNNWLIDWLVFTANFSSISAISWHEQILHIYQTYRNKCLFIKQLGYNIYK